MTDQNIPDPDYLRTTSSAGEKKMLPTPSIETIRNEVLRLRREYRHLLPKASR